MSSHREAPEISTDPVADNTDTYAFVSPDNPKTVTIITNYLPADDHDRVRNAYGINYERLVELKRRYDPDNLFHLNQNIDPS